MYDQIKYAKSLYVVANSEESWAKSQLDECDGHNSSQYKGQWR